ncbi:MAG: endolytic transglycosylase MltG [Armatimonadetes bacterium]|nr:endolytic transglycosylase MltG [Candidatus Hippobium faecium]
MKKKNKKSKSKIFTSVISVILIIICWIWFIGSAPVNVKETVFIGVEKGETINSVSEKLSENRVIRNKTFFKIVARLMHADSRIRYGTHRFSGTMPLSAVINELMSDHSKFIRLTVPEGWTAAQIENKLEKIASDYPKMRNNFASKAVSMSVIPYDHLYGDSCEGYLFPDTYSIDENADAEKIIEIMLKNFDAKVSVPYMSEIEKCGEKYFGTDDYNEALYKVLTVASLIEREVRVDGERETVASVIYNRLKKGMPLQVDATVTYEPGKSRNNKERVLYSDLKKKTPYNTYVIKGLPKGPICNPGIKCIEAAIRPEKTDYLYYVAKSDRTHLFSEDFDGHRKNIEKVR